MTTDRRGKSVVLGFYGPWRASLGEPGMANVVRASRQSDGRYRLDFGESPYVSMTYPEHGASMARFGGEWDAEHRQWIVPEKVLAHFNRIEKVFGVLAEPFCHEPAGFFWVTESMVAAGQQDRARCIACGTWGGPRHFIDVMGEADVARETYEAEFQGKHEAVS